MSRVAFVNGRFVPLSAEAIPVEDRGFQFADGVYEVWSVREGRLYDAEGHFTRLSRSLRELAIEPPMTRAALEATIRETLRRNRVRHGIVYLQITRGVAPRDHAFPSPAVPATVVLTAKSQSPAAQVQRAERGAAVVTLPETRWARCDIKSVSLLPNVLAKQAAKVQGAQEAWFVDADGFVTEGASSNAWIVCADGVVRTRALTANILAGVTRATMMEIAASLQLRVEEAPFTVADAKAAREAFITSATSPAISVVRIDGAPIGSGAAGPVARAMREAYARVTEPPRR